ncbi:MAG: XRE family transcriptional regulator [Bacteroidetes bacterium HGW-Bacteroidetes-8]|jgi:transcriptional regulator with XRE-family HTH domain|nr:MAG: XRE family transcriptional regulator [Bacteroidetes bacterium HGW-Bacteroidetes-8]
MKNELNDNMLSFISTTHDSLMLGIARRVKERRLEKDWTQRALAVKAGISFGSFRRFESSGEISLRSLIMIAFALGTEDDFLGLFSTQTYRSIDELMNVSKAKQRKRGGKNE